MIKKTMTAAGLLLGALLLYIAADKAVSLFTVPPDFVYGLAVEEVRPVAYLPEADARRLPPDAATVAVYSLKKDTGALERIFKTAGLPYYRCRTLEEAAPAPILFLDFTLEHAVTLTPAQQAFLERYVRDGGIVIGNELFTVRGDALKTLFGYRGYAPARTRKGFSLQPSPYFSYFNVPEERTYTLSTLASAPFTNAIRPSTAEALALYDDKTPAVTLNRYGKGKAILLGISLFDLRYRNLFGRDYNANRQYCNGFEPLSDFIVLFLKGLYERTLPASLTLHTAPAPFKATLILTHDVDYAPSMKHIADFVALESAMGVRSTFTIQTKYARDNKDVAFFTPENLPFLLDAQQKGFEIASHTVVHTRNFSKLAQGTCDEAYPAYRPLSLGEYVDGGRPTVCGELKVSKALLLGSGIDEVVSFRSGELLYNAALPQVMETLGYRYGSNFSAEDVLSYFPYRYMRDNKHLHDESSIWEFPLTYEDEALPPLYFRTDDALALLQKVYDNGGVFTLLIHPDLTAYRLKNLDLAFLKAFLSRLPEDLWTDTLQHVGDFWDKRDRIVFRYEVTASQLRLQLYSPVAMERVGFHLHGLELRPENADVRVQNGMLLVDVKAGWNSWEIARR